MTSYDVQKILNLKHAWEFILDKDVIQADTDYYLLCHFAKLVNEGYMYDGGRLRGVTLSIGRTSHTPPLPIETVVIEHIDKIIPSGTDMIVIPEEHVPEFKKKPVTYL